jgi:hypothetical protein
MTILRRHWMNTFKQSLEEIAALTNPLEEEMDLLPRVPAFLSPKEAAYILAVSFQTIERMLEQGDIKPDKDGDILKADLIGYIKTHTLADLPILEEK